MKRQHHELKIAPEHFTGVIDGSKKAEFRLNDRDFQCGDAIRLREWDQGDFTGREVHVVVTDCTDVTQYINATSERYVRGKRFVMLSFSIIPGSACVKRYLR